MLWEDTESVLGRTLEIRALWSAHDDSLAKLNEAGDAFRAAVSVLNGPDDAKERLSVQTELASVLDREATLTTGGQSQDFLKQEAGVYRGILDTDPKDFDVIGKLDALYQNRLFDFAKSYEFREQALVSNPSDLGRFRQLEAEFTTSKFQACLDTFGSIVHENPDAYYIFEIGAFRIFYVACQWGAGNKEQAVQAAGDFLLLPDADKKDAWKTTGDRQYLATAPAFAAGRTLWIQLFQALEDGDRETMEKTGKELGELMQR
jgi:tetratricopeptide (TPR) repeat protein